MTRVALACLLALPSLGCTADFFVGPEATDGSTSAATEDDGEGPGDPSTADPPTTTGETLGSTTLEPTTTTEDTLDPPDTSTTTGEESDTLEPSTSSSTTEPTTAGETEEPQDCIPKDVESCEVAYPACLWTGEACVINECNVAGGEKECLPLNPECAWEGDGCIPTGCSDEAECSPLEPGVCVKTPGCIVFFEQCFALECVPCGEVKDIKLCNELPACGYNKLREACLPL